MNEARRTLGSGLLLAWLIVGSAARFDPPVAALLLFGFVAGAVACGPHRPKWDDLAAAALVCLFAALYSAATGYGPLAIAVLTVELLAFSLLLSNPAAWSRERFVQLVLVYALVAIAWKATLSDGYLLDRGRFLFNGPIKFATICLVAYALVLFRPRERLLPGLGELAVLAFLALCVVATLSRMPLAALAVICVLYAAHRRSLRTLAVMALAAAVLVWALSNTRYFYVDPEAGGVLRGILRARYDAWAAALEAWRASPVLGAPQVPFIERNPVGLKYPHNLLLDIGYHLGLVGVALFAIIIALRLRRMGAFNLVIFLVGLTSGTIDFWIKAVFVLPDEEPEPDVERSVADPVARTGGASI